MGRRLLIAEKEQIIAIDIKNFLKEHGYKCPAIVSSGKELLRKSREINPDLIIAELTLNNENDSIETVKEIREYSNVPVIFLTSFNSQFIKKTINGITNTEYITKPFVMKELIPLIEHSLN